MPPRYAYWTIIVDDKPTAFRAGAKDDLLPTFNRIKSKNDTAVMMWFQNGKLWPSRIDAQEAMIGRGEAGRRSDPRQAGGGFRDRERRPTRDRVERTAWTPRGEPSTPAPKRNADDKLDWKPKGEFVPAPKRKGFAAEGREPRRSSPASGGGSERPEWKPKGEFTPAPRRSEKPEWKSKSSEKPAWKPKGSFDRDRKPEWKSKSSSSEKPAWKPKGSVDREERPRSFKRPAYKPSGDDTRSAKPEWKPKGFAAEGREPRRSSPASEGGWKPKERAGGFSGSRSAKPEWKPKGSFDRERKPEYRSRTERPEWKPKGEASSGSRIPDPGSREKRKWVPKEEYKKSMGIEAKRDDKWRPGGEHKDPRQKFKDAKKAKWTKFKQNIRARSGGKGKKSS